jgi:hypothetical protein
LQKKLKLQSLLNLFVEPVGFVERWVEGNRQKKMLNCRDANNPARDLTETHQLIKFAFPNFAAISKELLD